MTFLRSVVRGVGALLIATGLIACAGTMNQTSVADDAAVADKARAALAKDPGTSALNVKVGSYRGTVNLSGFVDSQQEKRQAEQVTRLAAGGGNVKNDLLVRNQWNWGR